LTKKDQKKLEIIIFESERKERRKRVTMAMGQLKIIENSKNSEKKVIKRIQVLGYLIFFESLK
jgi:hypothetical protein